MRYDKKIRPLPEAPLAKEVTVEEHLFNGMTDGMAGWGDSDKAHMSIPMGETYKDFQVRMHELGHLMISPKEGPRGFTGPKVNPIILNLLEDVRVNHHLECQGISMRNVEAPDSIGVMECEKSIKLDEAKPNVNAIKMLKQLAWLPTSSVDTNAKKVDAYENHPVINTLNTYMQNLIANQTTYGQPMPFEHVVGFAETLTEHLHLIAKLEEEREARKARLGELAKGEETAVRMSGRTMGKDGRYIPVIVKDRVDPAVLATVDKATWGTIAKLGQVPTTEGMPGHKLQRRRRGRLGPEGHTLARPDRLRLDGMAFRQTKRRPGGTVLVDVSGSMSLSHENIVEIVEHFPRSTVAIYSGDNTRLTGQLWIVAKKGRMATEETIAETRGNMGGANVIDGPALEWLGKQEGPRIWVSDGQVTGIYEQQSVALSINATDTINRYTITRVGDVNQVDAILARLNRGTRPKKASLNGCVVT